MTWKTMPNQWLIVDTMLVMPSTLRTVSDPLTSTSLPVVYRETAGRLPGSWEGREVEQGHSSVQVHH